MKRILYYVEQGDGEYVISCSPYTYNSMLSPLIDELNIKSYNEWVSLYDEDRRFDTPPYYPQGWYCECRMFDSPRVQFLLYLLKQLDKQYQHIIKCYYKNEKQEIRI